MINVFWDDNKNPSNRVQTSNPYNLRATIRIIEFILQMQHFLIHRTIYVNECSSFCFKCLIKGFLKV